MVKKLTQEQFISKAQNFHGIYKNDYCKTKFINVRCEIIVICKKHNYEFTQKAMYHLKYKHSCPVCFDEYMSDFYKNRKFCNNDIDDWLIENNKNFIRNENYFNNKKHMEWKCLICDDIWTATWSSIRSGTECSVCSGVMLNDKIIDIFLENNKKKYKKNRKCYPWRY